MLPKLNSPSTTPPARLRTVKRLRRTHSIAKATTSTGSRHQKIQRHPNDSAIHPPSEGPTAGASAHTRLPMPIMRPIRSSGACSWITLNIRGSAMPVPTPSRILPHNSMGKLMAFAPHRMPLM